MGRAVTGRRGELRIIGGDWRSRRLRFPAGAGLRPTPDRVRETLFNWLGPRVIGARALDLFAGSGALGLEALSRGASRVDFVERRRPAVEALRANLALLGGGSRADVVCAEALSWLRRAAGPWDLVFIDPPFDSDLAGQAMDILAGGERLNAGARIYFECRRGAGLAGPWRVLRRTCAGDVEGTLLVAGEGGSA